MSEKNRRCFFDISIDGELAGRIVIELYDNIVPQTCENFLQLCTGQAGIGKKTGKPLSYKGTPFHRVVKNFMIQSGDFSEQNGTGGESIYGGVFEDENFSVKHNQPFILSMANRGENTNGSQFFITTNSTPHLDGVHVAFGRVLSGQDIVTRIEHLKVNSKSRPLSDVIISNCGQLIKKKSESDEEEEEKISKKKKKHKKEKRKESSDEEDKSDHEKKDKENGSKEAGFYSTIKPEDLPQVPETHNFLMRRNSPKNNDERGRMDSGRHRSRSPRNRPKVKGRGRLLYRSKSRDGSSTPPHWKREADRLISMNNLKKIQEKQKKLAFEQETKETLHEKERQDNYGYRKQSEYEQRDRRTDRRNDTSSRHDDRHKDREEISTRGHESSNRHREDRHRNEDNFRRNDDDRRKDYDRINDYQKRGRERSAERTERREDRHRNDYQKQGDDQMQKYESRRQRRPSDIEREKYRKGDLAGVQPADLSSKPNYEAKQSTYQPTSTNAYQAAFQQSASSYYPAVQQQQYASQQQPSYNNGAQRPAYDHNALAKAAAAYAAKNVLSVPAGHYSTTTSKESKKVADLQDVAYVLETESSVKPLEDTWDKDHGKRTKRVHEVIENERVVVPPRTDPTAKKSRQSSERDRRHDSPPSKHRRTDDRRDDRRGDYSSRRNERSPDRRQQQRNRSRSCSRDDRRRRSSTTSSSSSSSSSSSRSSSSDSRNSRDRDYRRR